MATVEIVPLTTELFIPARDALVAAFAEDPLICHLAPVERHRRAWLPVLMEANLRLTWPDGHTYVALRDGKVVGAVGANPPGKYPPSTARILGFVIDLAVKPLPWIPPIWHLTRGLKYMKEWDRLHFKGPHWYIFILGVAPKAQGTGCGRALVERIYREAGPGGEPVYLETQNEKNLRFYNSMGLQLTEKVCPSPTGPPVWGLLRRG